MNEVAGKAPDTSLVKPAWIVLIVGWVIMLLPIPMTGWLGGVIAGIGGCILAIVNLVRGVVGIGIVQLLCALIVTPIVYWIGLAIFGAALVSAAGAAG
ncbi:MAG: hypothetical protein KF822_01825 [Steroidobacteraceae bacterium]|nr:hypothetical protein [Steroidobacteraceae bacterium]